MKKDILTYNDAVEELERLIKRIENPETKIEDLSKEVKKAIELVGFCKEQIRGYKEECDKLLE
jgi:exodeoxyribonuclease VII small subunit